jgi:hypothetical protein
MSADDLALFGSSRTSIVSISQRGFKRSFVKIGMFFSESIVQLGL